MAATTTWTYDLHRGWLTSETYADGEGPSYTYDRLGRRTTIVQGSTTAPRLYDLAGHLLSENYTGGTARWADG